MADRHFNILGADRRYRLYMELSSKTLLEALLRAYPHLKAQQEEGAKTHA